MELTRGAMFLLLSLACIGFAEANPSMLRSQKNADLKVLQVKAADAGTANISPELHPESSKKFFDKDYPFDKRPSADSLHFKHPYPVVQDSHDFDTDFVKDENSDNGNWKAQETYDKLRQKLAKEKRDLAKALAKKNEEERELKEAMKKREEERKEKEEAAKKVDKIKHEEEEEDKRHDEENKKKKPKHEGPVKHVPHEVFHKDVEVKTDDTEKAMDSLEECKKQLKEAREHLKELMDELEEAKKAQNAANAALDDSLKTELQKKEEHNKMKKKVKSEFEEYEEARAAYLKQKAVVAKMEVDIHAAEAKVKDMRDSADEEGGVYPTPKEQHHKSAAAHHWSWALLLAVAYCASSA